MTDVAVVGAGITGLVAARELVRRGMSVDLYERWPDVSGMASAFDVGGGVLVDRYYHHLFESDDEMTRLHDELLPGELEWHRSSMGMYARGRVWPFTTPLDLLRYGPLPPHDRVRLGLAVLRLRRRTDWERMDDEPAVDRLRNACGERALREVWGPLLLGKFGEEAAGVPLAWLWSKLVLRRKLRGDGARYERLGYPRGSFQKIAWALADDIRAGGGRIHVDRSVLWVEGEGDGFTLRCAAPGSFRRPAADAVPLPERTRARRVLFTTPADVTSRVAAWPPSTYGTLLDWTYRAAVVLVLEVARQATPIYWLNIVDPQVPFLALIEHTNLVPAERYPARYLYVSNYVAQDSPLLGMSADELLARYLPALAGIAGLRREEVLRHWVFREPAAQPVPRVGNRRRVLPIRSERPGMYIANTTQIYPEDRGTNYSVRLGRQAALEIASDIRLRPVQVTSEAEEEVAEVDEEAFAGG